MLTSIGQALAGRIVHTRGRGFPGGAAAAATPGTDGWSRRGLSFAPFRHYVFGAGEPACGSGSVMPARGRSWMLNNIGLPGLLLIVIVVLVLFGRGKIASIMGEVGKGITSFKKGVNEGKQELEAAAAEEAKDITPESEKTGT